MREPVVDGMEKVMRYTILLAGLVGGLLLSALVLAEPGCDSKYERDYNIFNPINELLGDNPLNSINSIGPDNAINSINTAIFT